MEDRSSHKRKGDFSAMAARKTPKLAEKGSTGKMSFAQRMMAKMGHVEGQGLGKSGEGIINPIEVKLRPQGAGVGAVREKTEQYKQEQRRAAEARGEEYEDSSDEERKARRRRKEKAREMSDSGRGTSGMGDGVRRKTKYRTVEEVQAAAPGLELPRAMLGSIVDATGSATKLLTSTAGLMSGAGMIRAETAEDKIKKKERIDLEAYIDAWHGLQERKLHLEEHEGQLQVDLGQMKEDIAKMNGVLDAMASLRLGAADGAISGASGWDDTIAELKKLQETHPHEIESCKLSDAAVAILAPLFELAMDAWQPLDDPTKFVDDLLALRPILGVKEGNELTTNGEIDPELRKYRKQKATTPFETLMYRVWLPKLRSTITAWDYRQPDSLVLLVQKWRPILPPFILSSILDQLILPKLVEGLRIAGSSIERHMRKGNDGWSASQGWLFAWLPYLPTHQLDAKSSSGLVSGVKRLLRHAFTACDIARGPPKDLTLWDSVIPGEIPHLLVKHLLPRLAAYLSLNFEVDPADQQLTALEAVTSWRGLFKSDVFARLLAAEFFPKILTVLHDWITGPEADINEVYPWLAWWKTVLPKELQAEPDVRAGWHQGQKMIEDALQIMESGGDVSTDLPRPIAGPARPIAKQKSSHRSHEAARTETGARLQFEPSFKEIVDEWCAEQDLTLIPLREAHPKNGRPLFRITASATGKGGAIVYFDDNLVWAQRKGQRDVYDVFGLEDLLLKRVESK